MNKIEIKTEKATLLVVDDSNWDGCIYEFVGVNYNGYKHLGKVSEITEDQWKCIVDAPVEHKIHSYNPLLTKRYFRFKDYKSDADILKTATESGLSLLKANGVLLENKYQDDWDELCIWGHGDFSKDGKSSFDLYTEEQEKVWSNPHVFIKIVRGN